MTEENAPKRRRGKMSPRERMHVSHNDFAPYNLLFNGDSFDAVIDFDLAGPGQGFGTLLTPHTG